ncbi:MAG: RNA polymerase sigma factor [Oscillospiraceae bacterium]|nr:RNA polymerase sigma factor [Oscillospiraceae bacterium]
MLNDTEIIELFFERSEKAISELSSKYGGIVLKIAENVLHNRQDAEECVNDTYLGVWNAIPPQRPNSLTAFVCRIARNISINRYKRDSFRKRGGVYDVCFDELQECIRLNETVESLYAEKELSELIDEFLDTLDKKNRMIFVRRYYYMDTFGDIALAAGMSEGSVRTRLTRIRGKLKKFLESRGVSV